MKLLKGGFWCSIAVALFSLAFAPASFAKEDMKNKEGNMIAFVMAVDNHEIEAADTALNKDISTPVADYAKMLKEDHTKNLSELKNLSNSTDIHPVESPAIKTLVEKGDKSLASMDKLNGKKFENAYIDAMIKGHKEALAKIDSYLKNVKNESLKNFLTETRNAVATHLQDAKKLKQ